MDVCGFFPFVECFVRPSKGLMQKKQIKFNTMSEGKLIENDFTDGFIAVMGEKRGRSKHLFWL
jgi:hypothetical protein